MSTFFSFNFGTLSLLLLFVLELDLDSLGGSLHILVRVHELIADLLVLLCIPIVGSRLLGRFFGLFWPPLGKNDPVWYPSGTQM